MTDADRLAEIKAWWAYKELLIASRVTLGEVSDYIDWLLARVEALEQANFSLNDANDRLGAALTISDEEAGRIVVQAFQLFVRSHGQDEPVAWSSMSIQERAIWISCAANLFADLRRRAGMTP